MKPLRFANRFIATLLLALLFAAAAVHAQIVLSGNENKIDLTSGTPKPISTTEPDSITLLDFSQLPPAVSHLTGIANTVVGPPSNIAISPDGNLALIANSIRLDSSSKDGYVPDSYIHILDLSIRPPKLLGRVQTDLQPSGISFAPSGRLALVANRASGTISVLAIDGKSVRQIQSLKVCQPADQISDVAVSPDGHTVLASVRKGGYLALLRLERERLTDTGQKISVYGQPYRCVITPDGQLGLTAGMGFGNGVDSDALSVIDLKLPRPRAVDHVAIGASPESIEISPDGRLLAAVVMEGSNLAPDDPNHTNAGALVILERRGQTFVKNGRLSVGRIPEGVAFTADGKYLVVQCHPDRQLRLFTIKGTHVEDTGQRINLPGMPSSLRAAAK